VIIDGLPTRLRWDGGRRSSCARWEGVEVPLCDRPAWMTWAEVDWAPQAVAISRDHPYDRERLLERHEIEAIIAWLQTGARRVVMRRMAAALSSMAAGGPRSGYRCSAVGDGHSCDR
jgi:hypothetical protein